MVEKPPTSFRLSEECRLLIRRIGQPLGIKDAAVVEIAVRRLAERELTGAPPETDSLAGPAKANPKRPCGREGK
jgi:hypothetical protein